MTYAAVSAAVQRAGRESRRRPGLRVAGARRNGGTQSGRFSDGELLRGVRQVAGELGCTPSLCQYERVGRELGLACGQTVCERFGGWHAALRAAGLNSTIPGRVHPRRWHIAACWRALESVADQLGDPPRYRRYAQLAAGREDLPSATTVSVRLGPWAGIAAALQARPLAARNGRTRPRPDAAQNPGPASAAYPVNGRVLTVRGARTLAHLREHPGASGMAVKHATGIGHYSQAWKVLVRLEREGMVKGHRVGRARTWSLTGHGRAVLKALPEWMYAA